MTKQLNKFAVYTISVLTAKILSEHLFDFIIAYKKNQNPYIDTVVGMAITAFIFFPAIVVMNKYLKVLTEKYLKQSKKTVKKQLGFYTWDISRFCNTVLCLSHEMVWN